MKNYVIRNVRPSSRRVVNGIEVDKRAYQTFEECGFEINEYGGIRSDFASLVNSQSLLVMQNAAARLQELRALEPDNSNKSFEDIVREIRPRWCQSPKQLMEFEKYLIDNKIDVLQKDVDELKRQEEERASALDAQASATTE